MEYVYSSTPLDDVQPSALTDKKKEIITSKIAFMWIVFSFSTFGATAPLVVGNRLIPSTFVGVPGPFSRNQLQSKNPLQYPVPLLPPFCPLRLVHAPSNQSGVAPLLLGAGVFTLAS